MNRRSARVERTATPPGGLRSRSSAAGSADIFTIIYASSPRYKGPPAEGVPIQLARMRNILSKPANAWMIEFPSDMATGQRTETESRGLTPLQYAAKVCSTGCVRLLREFGANCAAPCTVAASYSRQSNYMYCYPITLALIFNSGHYMQAELASLADYELCTTLIELTRPDIEFVDDEAAVRAAVHGDVPRDVYRVPRRGDPFLIEWYIKFMTSDIYVDSFVSLVTLNILLQLMRDTIWAIEFALRYELPDIAIGLSERLLVPLSQGEATLLKDVLDRQNRESLTRRATAVWIRNLVRDRSAEVGQAAEALVNMSSRTPSPKPSPPRLAAPPPSFDTMQGRPHTSTHLERAQSTRL